jgi:putative SOS response-associated peptidase YedK
MCGRYALHANEEEIMSHFHLHRGFAMHPRYNISPGQMLPIICQYATQVEFSRWGFVPSWTSAIDGQIPIGHRNARIESLSEKPTFKEAFKKQRCLIPASGYYEWRTYHGQKQPYYISLKNQPLIAFAGIWSLWRNGLGEEVLTTAMITTQALSELKALHERMPIIIAKQHYQNWLAKEYDLENLTKILVNPTAENFAVKAVSPRMSNPKFEGVECIQSL